MATPHVAGAFAALRSAAPTATADQIEQALKGSGRTISGARSGLPLPRIDVYAALQRLKPGPAWHPWASLGGSTTSFPDCEGVGNGAQCWIRTAGNTLAWDRSADGNAWSGFTDLGGSVAGPPRCLARGSRTDCFVATSGSRLAQITYDGSSWGAWASRGGNATGRPACVPASSGLGARLLRRRDRQGPVPLHLQRHELVDAQEDRLGWSRGPSA